VILVQGQREPNLIFRSEGNRLNGFSGCNTLAGTYQLNGSDLNLHGIAATKMACLQGMDVDAAFLPVLDKVRKWKVVGQHLELYDSRNTLLARFEAQPKK
jgi:heat shock protein HslJ